MSHDYYILNKETGKLELHFEKSTYMGLSENTKSQIKGAFLWGRNSGCWISRAKWPNTSYAENIAKEIGLEDAGETGERLSFAEQMQSKADRAERRAERYENRADAAEARGEALQKPIDSMHGDIAFFTQPNINTSTGRAFTRRRSAMWASWEKGFEEFNKSDYWKDRAKTARKTSEQPELRDRAFLMRRIEERLADIRKLKKNVEEYEGYEKAIEAGETPRNKYGWDVKITGEQVQSNIDRWLEILEAKLDELGFYQDCLDSLGGVAFSRENIKPGYIVKMQRSYVGICEVVSCGPKTVKVKSGKWISSYPYAEIEKVVKAEEKTEIPVHTFKVGDSFESSMWNRELRKFEPVVCEIIKTTDKSVTIKAGEGKPFVRKPYMSAYDPEHWYIDLGDNFCHSISRQWKAKAV